MDVLRSRKRKECKKYLKTSTNQITEYKRKQLIENETNNKKNN